MTKTNTIIKYVCASAIGLSLVSFPACTDDIEFGDDFMESYNGSQKTIEETFSNPTYAVQWLTGIYPLQHYGLPYGNRDYVPKSSNPYTGKLDGFTDLYALHWSSTTLYNAYYLGTLNSNQMPLFSYTGEYMWQAVYKGWTFIDNIDKVTTLSETLRNRYKAEARCLIAVKYFEMFACYGGLPVIDHAIQGSEDVSDLPRATVEETVDFMVKLLDDAIPYLPWAWNGNTSDTDNTNVGRWTKAGAMALKAKILTFAASPMWNNDKSYYDGSTEAEQQHLVWYGNYSAERWSRALKACQDFFDALSANGFYDLVQADGKNVNAYRLAYRKGYISTESPEVIHSVRVRLYDNWANGYYAWSYWVQLGRNSYLPTFEYMEMFPWSDGTPFDWEKDQSKIFGGVSSRTGKVISGQLFYTYPNATEKNATRDPRLYEEILVNGTDESLDWSTGITSGQEYELWVGGSHEGFQVATLDTVKNADGKSVVQTKIIENMTSMYSTGFGVVKYQLTGSDYLRQPLQWVSLSLSEMYLMYAECLAQTGDLTGAIAQVDIVRKRVGLKSLGSAVSAAKTDKETLIEEILRERACELGMTNNRYYDQVRYRRTDWLTKKLHGLVTYRQQQNADGSFKRVLTPYIGAEKNAGNTHPTSFTYEKFELVQPAAGRALWSYNSEDLEVKKWLLMPFPIEELNKNYGLIQNPGW
ncbi:MAG: RagB/SusD family nutrient uptake outer membrane protein [Marinilabiliaceae bacterium]|nr:RagB/SusD family nutrient uptake outer membrane protein [Marinilabiliaceae bacterium]